MSKQLTTAEFYVEGMHCAACELTVENAACSLPAVSKADARLASGKLHVTFKEEIPEEEFLSDINTALEDSAYRVQKTKVDYKAVDRKELVIGLIIASAFIGAFVLLQNTSFESSLLSVTSEGSLITPFVVGIVASLSTCMAVVGGVVLTLSSKYSLDHQRTPIAQFHLSRLISFFIFGGLLGLLGNTLRLTDNAIAVLNIVLFFMMAIIGINLLGVSNGLNKFQLRLPKSFGKGFLKLQESQSSVVPIALGAATFILPCGFTQAMQVQAFTTGNFIQGALTMFIFALGTLPVLALLSIASVNFSNHKYSGIFFKTAGFLVVGFAIFSLLSALAVWGVIPPTSTFLGI